MEITKDSNFNFIFHECSSITKQSSKAMDNFEIKNDINVRKNHKMLYNNMLPNQSEYNRK